MTLDIRTQALSLLLAFAGGAALGLLYDLLRPIRWRSGNALWDALFCLCAASLAFLFAMRSESGTLGAVEILSALLGLLSHRRFVSPALLPILDRLAQKIGVLWIYTQIFAKKVPDTAKKLFQISRE